jgi:hypothetical protein
MEPASKRGNSYATCLVVFFQAVPLPLRLLSAALNRGFAKQIGSRALILSHLPYHLEIRRVVPMPKRPITAQGGMKIAKHYKYKRHSGRSAGMGSLSFFRHEILLISPAGGTSGQQESQVP